MSRTQYFLGGNTAHGFYSLFNSLCPPEQGDFLWVLKGGPGGGKSGFMKKIGCAAEERGLDVEYAFCSGDPNSLDAVYLPALHTGYVDGTAPHVIEPRLPAVTGLYLDLGQFCDRAALRTHSEELLKLQKAYQAQYRVAYRILSAASGAAEAAAGIAHEPHLTLSPIRDTPGRLTRRFSRAFTCVGMFEAEKPVGPCIGSFADLAALREHALAAGYDVIDHAHPLLPELTERIDLPQTGQSFLADSAFLEDCFSAFLCDAVQALAAARELHDELEAVYNPHVNYEMVSRLTEQHIHDLFG